MHTVSLEGQGDALAPVPCMLGVPQAARMLGIGRTLAYELVRTGEWPTRLKDVTEIDVVEEQLAHSEYVDKESRQIAIERAKEIDEVARQRGMGGDLQT